MMFYLPVKKYGRKILVYGGIGFVLLMFLFPLYWIINCFFMARPDLTSFPPNYWPVKPTLDNLREVWEYYLFPNFQNTAIIAAGTTLLCIAIGSLAAYSLSRFAFRGREGIANWILSIRMMPPIIIIVPLFIMITNLKLIDTHVVLIFLHSLVNLPFVVWLMRGFFDEIPIEIEECAKLDGCSTFGVWIRIVLPLALTGLVVTGLLVYIFSWNEFLMATIFTRSRAGTLSVVVGGLTKGVRGTELGIMSALLIVTISPVIVLSVFLQKHLARGLTFGAIK